ncbi:MAG: amidohydrolase [Firmicutes bacterium]|nr:amidohydrolase [Bacillota bacterium]
MKYQIEEIRSRVDDIFDEVVEFRRELHMYPELSEQECETAKRIQSRLKQIGVEFTPDVAGHGVVGTIYGQNREKAVGIRADIDALPITEQTDFPYKSQTPGIMHACGHDIHTAILYGTAKILSEMKEQLPGSVKLFFQPSEETVGGAKQMIEEGCLAHPEVQSVIGLHVDSGIPAGAVLFTPGAMNAASCEFYVTVMGKSCHGAHPDEGIDPLIPACNMVTALQSIITRRLDPADTGLITVGQFHSGTKNNVIPGETKFSGIIRTLNLENREKLKEEIKRICHGIAVAHGATVDVEFFDSYPSLENDDQLYQWMQVAAEKALGSENIVVQSKPSLGADDFSYFCHESRGLYYMIGTGLTDGRESFSIHSEFFNPDEECIRTGILTEVVGALKILEEESKTW